MSKNYSEGPSAGCITSLVVIGLLLIVAVIGGCTTLKRVDPGYAGVVVDFGKGTSAGQPEIYNIATGTFTFVNPIMQTIVEYPIAQQTLSMVRSEKEGKIIGDDSVACQDTTGIPIHIDSSVLWRVDTAKVGNLYLLRPNLPLVSNSNNDIESQVVRREARNAITIACSRYRYDQVLGKDKIQFNAAVEEYLRTQLGQSFILVDKVAIGEVYLNEQQQKAIMEKATAEQQSLAAAFLKAKAENEAAGSVAQAEGAKKVQILQAEGQAESVRLVQQQLSASPLYIQYLYAQKWDGKYPTTMLSENSIPIVGTIPIVK